MSTPSTTSILIVEDSPTAAEVLRIQLEDGLSRPFDTMCAGTLAAAQGLLKQHRFDVVLLDLNLPDSQGLATFTNLHRSYSAVPYIVLSGMSEESIAVEAVRGGAQDYLVKSNLEHSQQINRSVQFALERFRRVEVESELMAAQRVQNSLYPAAAPEIPGLDIYGHAIPAEHVSGDYYDFIPMTNEALGIVVGDVSGHGLGPALRMAETRASLHALSHAWEDLHDLATTHEDLCDILRRTNAVLNGADTGQFVTLFFAKIDLASRTFTYASAGHRAYLIRSDGTHEELDSTGPLLGLLPDIEITESARFQLHPGDVLFIPTDGIEETQTSDRRMFGKARMLADVTSNRTSTSEKMVDSVCQTARRFAASHPQLDDMTATIIRVNT